MQNTIVCASVYAHIFRPRPENNKKLENGGGRGLEYSLKIPK